MANVVIYSYQFNPTTIRTVYHDSINYGTINYFDNTGTGAGTMPFAGTIISRSCLPGTTDLYEYLTSTSAPYATYQVKHNSAMCGYVPPACDIMLKSFVITDQTIAGVNNGTVNIFAVSSFAPITYHLTGLVDLYNTTGYFTGLAPGTYFISATDANGCVINKTGTVQAFTNTKTHYKYRLAFQSVIAKTQWELRLLDQYNNYDASVYPVDIYGTEAPIIYKCDDSSEDKTTAIISKNLAINIIYDGTTFTVEEFAKADEKKWKVELYKDGNLEFQGWLIPDEIQDFYADPAYAITLTATDGLPSLKGNTWGDGSGGLGYSTSQIPQYGYGAWCKLLKQCLDQLGYNYGQTIIVSSLRFNNTYDNILWFKIGTWSDILYDSSGVALDTYTALELLLKGLNLCIFQNQGSFVLINWNDLYYVNNPLKSTEYQRAFYQLDGTFSYNVGNGLGVPQPTQQAIGFNSAIKPEGGSMQPINYDKAYNIYSKVDFNILALLYPNPDFEIGPVAGAIPSGFTAVNGGVPGSGLINTDSYSGLWSFKVVANGTVRNQFIENSSPYYSVDQINKKAAVSFNWKVPQSTDKFNGYNLGYVFSFALIFQDATGGAAYFLNTANNPPLDISNTGGTYTPKNPPGTNNWTIFDPPTGNNYSEGQLATIKGLPVTDYVGWQNFSIETPQFPGSGIGTLQIRFYDVKEQLYDISHWPNFPVGSSVLYYYSPASGNPGYYLIDNLNITISDYSPSQYSLQTGEEHKITSVTGVPQSSLKDVSPKLFTYPGNKRVAGNVGYGITYETSQVANKWNYALKTNDPLDRLPATINKAIARDYQRPMYKYQGELSANYVSFYGVFSLLYYPNVVFRPFTIDLDCRNETANVVLIEIDDTDAQNVYQYTQDYESNARRIVPQV